MDCRWFQENISRYYEGGMDAQEQLAIEQHAQSCPRCRQLYAEFPRLLKAMRSLPSVRPAVPLAQAFLLQAAPRRRGRGFVRAVAGIAAAAVVFVGGYAIVRNGFGSVNIPDETPAQTQTLSARVDETAGLETQENSGWMVDDIQNETFPDAQPEQRQAQGDTTGGVAEFSETALLTDPVTEEGAALPSEDQPPVSTLTIRSIEGQDIQEYPLPVSDVNSAAQMLTGYLEPRYISYELTHQADTIRIAMTLTEQQVLDIQADLSTLALPMSIEALLPDMPFVIVLTPEAN